MQEYKIIKDPLYGYIKIPIDLIENVIDTAEFQRLRRIIQTSYSPLYPSATHNRFIHSLGVYHLGCIASKSLHSSIKNNYSNDFENVNLDRVFKIFEYACLLHDVGHSPFSHTSEKFFGVQGDCANINDRLVEEINDARYEKEVPRISSQYAKPHEIMSAIIGVTKFDFLFENAEEKSFFARCITGYKYEINKNENDIIFSLKNILIEMLNSKIIDVDKLDYLIRDAQISGYQSVNIDYERFLSSLIVINSDTKLLDYAVYKTAISVIENIVYAHDYERKWIQAHPVIVYESSLLNNLIYELTTKIDNENKKIFSLESLSVEGQQFDNFKLSLLCDDDVIFLIKNCLNSQNKMEYFDRKSRKKNLWKSESEFKSIFSSLVTTGDLSNKITSAFNKTIDYLNNSSFETPIINEILLNKIKKELEELENSNLPFSFKNIQIKDKNEILSLVETFKEFSEKFNIDFDFTIISQKNFLSGFSKSEFQNIQVAFTKKGDQCYKFSNISNILNQERKDLNFYYIFYNKKDFDSNIDKNFLGKTLIKKLMPK